MKKEKVKNFIVMTLLSTLISAVLGFMILLFKDQQAYFLGLICGLILCFLDSLFNPFYSSKKPVLSKLSFGDLLFIIMSGLCASPIIFVNSKLTYIIGFILGAIGLSVVYFVDYKIRSFEKD